MSVILCPTLSPDLTDATKLDVFFKGHELEMIRDIFDPREKNLQTGKVASCKTNLFFGFFFDGTKNNYVLAEKDKSH